MLITRLGIVGNCILARKINVVKSHTPGLAYYKLEENNTYIVNHSAAITSMSIPDKIGYMRPTALITG